MSTAPSASRQPAARSSVVSTAPSAPARSFVSWAHEPPVSPLGPMKSFPTFLLGFQGLLSASSQVFCLLGSCPLRPQPPLSPIFCLLGSCALRPQPPALSAPCQSSVSWAHVHCALSAPCQVFCLLGSCPLRPQPCPPLPSLLSPGLIQQEPPARSSVSWAHEPPVSPLGPMKSHVFSNIPPGFPRPPVRLLPGLLPPGLMSTAPSTPS